MGVCNPDVSFLGGTISDDTILGDSLAISPGTGPGAAVPVNGMFANVAGKDSLATDVALRVRLESTSLYRRIFMQRGLPGGVTNGDSYSPVGNAAWRTAMNTFFNVIAGKRVAGIQPPGNAWCLRVQTRFPATAPGWQAIVAPVGVYAQASQYVQISTPSPILNASVPILAGSRVIIRGATHSIHVNGIWVVNIAPTAAVGGVWTYVLGPHRGLAQWNPPTGQVAGRVFPAIYTGQPITSSTDETGVWNRKSGKPSGSPHGRFPVR
jgi:hypothetical protein